MSRGNYINHATITRIVEWLLGVLLIHIKRVLSMVPATKGLPKRRSTSSIKVSGRMHNTAFKRPAFGFTVIISA